MSGQAAGLHGYAAGAYSDDIASAAMARASMNAPGLHDVPESGVALNYSDPAKDPQGENPEIVGEAPPEFRRDSMLPTLNAEGMPFELPPFREQVKLELSLNALVPSNMS